MIGTLVNFGAVILGGLIGALLKKGIPERISGSLLKAEGLAIALIGLTGVLSAMFSVDVDRLRDSGGLLLLISLVVGCLIGELLRLDDRLNGFGRAVEEKTGAQGSAAGFVAASLVFCIGSMTVLGPISEVLLGDRDILYIKAMLDFVTAIVLSSTLGIGVAFAAVPVLVIQGAFTLLAGVLSPYTGAPVFVETLRYFCMAGYAIVICIGLNFVVDAKIKTINLMPSLVVIAILKLLLPHL